MPEPTIQDPKTRRLYEYWLSRRGGARYPRRNDIDPVDFAFALGNVILIEVEHATGEFRYRLVGANCARRVGYDPTGATTAAIRGPENRRLIEERLRALMASGEPMAMLREEFADDRRYRYEVLYLPLGEGDRIDMILAFLNYYD